MGIKAYPKEWAQSLCDFLNGSPDKMRESVKTFPWYQLSDDDIQLLCDESVQQLQKKTTDPLLQKEFITLLQSAIADTKKSRRQLHGTEKNQTAAQERQNYREGRFRFYRLRNMGVARARLKANQDTMDRFGKKYRLGERRLRELLKD